MSLWQNIQSTIVNTANASKALAVDTVETYYQHRALSLNKLADTIRSNDAADNNSEAVTAYYKNKAMEAAQHRQQTAAKRLRDGDRADSSNKVSRAYEAVTSDVETIKEAGAVLWGYLKTADTLARATVQDTQDDIKGAMNSINGKQLKAATKQTFQEIATPVQQVWQQTTDTVRSLDLDSESQKMLDYFQEIGRDR